MTSWSVVAERARKTGRKAPAFTPATLAWIGGSLVGSLKTGGIEVARERWDESELTDNDPDESMDLSITPEKPAKVMLPDWTRPAMSLGTPSAAMVRPSETAQVA